MVKGTIIGAIGGLFIGGPIGGIIGSIIGSIIEGATKGDEGQPLFSSSSDDKQYNFQVSLLTLMAAVMQANGQTKRCELDYVKGYIRKAFHSEEDQHKALLVLKELLKQNIDVDKVCAQVKRQTSAHYKRLIISFLFGIGCADGELCGNEELVIMKVANGLGITGRDYDSIRYWELGGKYEWGQWRGAAGSAGGQQGGYQQRSQSQSSGYQRQQNQGSGYQQRSQSGGYSRQSQSSSSTKLQQAYAVLGLQPSVTDDELKKAYRSLVKKNHPDAYANCGEAVVNEQTQKVKAINEAYNLIKTQRGL